MMRITILVTIVWLSMLSASTVHAQRVESTLDSGHPVINCNGMPPSMYTTTAKGNTETVLKTTAANEKVYQRFAVSNSDNSSSLIWSEAFTLCRDVSGDGWRLPTQRELLLMWVLKRELEKTNGFAQLYGYYYWSATESSGSDGFAVGFDNGQMSNASKNKGYRVRCVRELMP